MNPQGAVVNENTNGIITVNGHSYEDPKRQTENTSFALLVAKHFFEPFKDSNGYGESIAKLSKLQGLNKKQKKRGAASLFCNSFWIFVL
jgi:uncharacterized FAD-dependent dehydrogenase